MKNSGLLLTICTITLLTGCGATQQTFSLAQENQPLTSDDLTYIDEPLRKLNALEVLPNDLIVDVNKSKKRLATQRKMDNLDNTVAGAFIQDTDLPAMILIDSLMKDNLLGSVSFNPMFIGSLLFSGTRKFKPYERGHLFFIGDESCNEKECARETFVAFLNSYITGYLDIINSVTRKEEHFSVDRTLTDVFENKSQGYYAVSGDIKTQILTIANVEERIIDGKYVIGTFGENGGLTFSLAARSDLYDRNLLNLIAMTKDNGNMVVYQRNGRVIDFSTQENRFVVRPECFGRNMIEKGHLYILTMFNCQTFANPESVPVDLAFSVH
jgi:hypothetical protein